MSDTTTAPVAPTKEVKPPLITSPIPVTRNGVTLSVIDETKTKGKAMGDHFLTLDIADLEANEKKQQDVFAYLGLPTVAAIVGARLRQMGQAITTAATDAKNVFNTDKAKQLFETLVFTQESIRSLNERMLEMMQTYASMPMETDEEIAKVRAFKKEVQDLASLLAAKKAEKAQAKDDEEDDAPAAPASN